MNITQVSQSQLKVTWPHYPRATHQEIIRRLKLINGAEFDKSESCWYVPSAQGDRLMDNFPKASYSVDAIWACTDAQHHRSALFFDSLTAMGVEFVLYDSGGLEAIGDTVSPLIQELISERADALRPLVLAALASPKLQRQPLGPIHGPYSAEDAKFEPLLKGIENARKAAAEVKYPKHRRRKAVIEQGKLGL